MSFIDDSFAELAAEFGQPSASVFPDHVDPIKAAMVQEIQTTLMGTIYSGFDGLLFL